MSEKSGIQMIEEIMERIEMLDRRFTIVEQMMKELMNRTSVLAQPLCEIPEEEIKPVGPGPSIGATDPLPKIDVTPETMQAPKAPEIGDPPGGVKATTINSKAMGKIKNSDGRAVSGVAVKIFDGNNNVIKETKTNRAGDWMCFLPPGRYKAEYFLKDMISANVNFNITPGQTLIRVAQPKA